MKEMLEFFEQLEVTELPAGTKLFRGSFEGAVRECSFPPLLTGRKYFDRNKKEAIGYAKANNPNFTTPTTDGIVFIAELVESCRVVIFSRQSNTYFRFSTCLFDSYEPLMRPRPGDVTCNPDWWREFEQSHLFPLIRESKEDMTIAGYLSGNSSQTEIFLDLDIAKIVIHGVEIIPFGTSSKK